MAGITKVNPAAVASNVEMVGKDLQFFTVDYVATNTSTGIDGAQMQTHRTVADSGTVVAIGPMVDSNTQQTFAVEGSDTIVAATLQASIRALGTVDGVNLGSATVTDTKLGILTAAAVA
jgi:hypothetical protein